MNKKTVGLLAGVASALFVAGYVTVNKYAYLHYDISALDYTLVFALCGALFGLVSLPRQLTKKTLGDIRQQRWSLGALSVAGFLAMGVFVFGQQYTTNTNSALLMTSTIVATSLFAYAFSKERLSAQQWLWAAVLFVGLYIGIVGFGGLTLHVGDAIVLGSVLLFGFGNAFSRVVMKRVSRPGIVPDVRLVVAGLCALVCMVLFVRDYTTVLAVLPLALLGGLFYWLCMKTFAAAVHLLGASEAIVLNNSQVFFSALAGVVLLSEGYSIEKLIGAVIAVTAIYFIAFRKKQ